MKYERRLYITRPKKRNERKGKEKGKHVAREEETERADMAFTQSIVAYKNIKCPCVLGIKSCVRPINSFLMHTATHTRARHV